MMSKYTVEITLWKNEELGLYYAENRAFDSNEYMVETFLDVCDKDGEMFQLGNLIESNQGKNPLSPDYQEVTVDDVEWELVEHHEYHNVTYPKSLFTYASFMLEDMKSRAV